MNKMKSGILGSFSILLFGLDPTSSARAEPVQFTKTAYVKKECGENESVVVERLNLPTDVPYKFVDYKVDITTRNSVNNGYTVKYLPEQHQVEIRLTATRHSECVMFLTWFGPNSWLGVNVTVNMIRNACDDPSPPPLEGTPVGTFVDGYKKTIAGLQCQKGVAHKKRMDIIQSFEQKILKKGRERKGTVQVQLASDRAKLAEIKEATDDYASSVEHLSKNYADLIQDFSRTKDQTANATKRELIEIAERAKVSDLKTIPNLVQKLITLSQSESSYTAEFIFKGRRLVGDMNAADSMYRERLAPFTKYMEQNELNKVDLVSRATESLDQVIRSSERRGIEYSKKINALLQAIQLREGGLIESTTNEKTRTAQAGALRLEATAKFLTEVTEASKKLWEAPKLSAKLQLPYLEADYLNKRKFLKYQDLCTKKAYAQTPWMQAGCNLIQPELGRVEIYLRLGLPRKLREGSRKMDPALTDKINSILQQGNLLAALREYDSALEESAQ